MSETQTPQNMSESHASHPPHPPTPPQNLKNNKEKEVNRWLTVNQHYNANAYAYARAPLITFGIKIPFFIYYKYNELRGSQKKFVREAVREFLINLINQVESADIDIVNVKQTQQTHIFNVNINVNSLRDSDIDSESESVSILNERIRILERRVKEYKDLLNEYKVKAEVLDKLLKYYENFVERRISIETFYNLVLKEIREVYNKR